MSGTRRSRRLKTATFKMKGVQHSRTTNIVMCGDDDDSEKVMMTYDGIMKIMNVSVNYNENSEAGDLRDRDGDERENRNSGRKASIDSIV
jgi:hypothetical protein